MQKLLAEKSKQLEEKNKRLKDIIHISEGFYIIIIKMAVLRFLFCIFYIVLQIIILTSYIFLAIKRVEKKVDNISDAMTRMESYLKYRSDDNNIVVRNVRAM